MAISAFELFLVSIVHSIRQLFVSLGISINLSIGIIATIAVLLLVALLVTCLVTWRQKTEKLMAMVRLGRRQSDKDTNTSQSCSTNIKSLSQPKETRKLNKKGLSKSISNLKELNNSVDLAASSSKTRGKKLSSKSASCSALNLPLPTEPGEKTEKKGASSKANNTASSIYDDAFQASLYVKENVAYGSNTEGKPGGKSVAAMIEKIDQGREQRHDYEQLEIVQSSRF